MILLICGLICIHFLDVPAIFGMGNTFLTFHVAESDSRVFPDNRTVVV